MSDIKDRLLLMSFSRNQTEALMRAKEGIKKKMCILSLKHGLREGDIDRYKVDWALGERKKKGQR
jgi:hypothetical protein